MIQTENNKIRMKKMFNAQKINTQKILDNIFKQWSEDGIEVTIGDKYQTRIIVEEIIKAVVEELHELHE